jgi:hypothetical protein
LIASLNDGEIQKLCEYLTDLAGPDRTITCPGGDTIVVGGGRIAECLAELRQVKMLFPNCTATVSNVELCTEDLTELSDAAWCDDLPLPASCEPAATAECGGL